MAQQIQVRDGDGVELRVKPEGLLVRPARRRYRLADLVRKITSSNRHAETEWGKRKGREEW